MTDKRKTNNGRFYVTKTMSYEICHLLLGFIHSSYDGGAVSQYEDGGVLGVDAWWNVAYCTLVL